LNIFELSPVDACKIKNQPKLITMPVLALVGDFPGSFALNSTRALAANVTGITVSLKGHWIPKEQPQFVRVLNLTISVKKLNYQTVRLGQLRDLVPVVSLIQ
jgi:hypothetical protein